MTRTALVLQHQRNAPPALLSDWARQRGIELTVVRADRAPTLPEPDAFALAITLGSDHSAGHRKPAWVDRELEWLRLADRAALPVLGICFGAQALAVALCGSVEHARQPETGWIAARPLRPKIVEDGPWFAWHEDVFVLPPAATKIARNGFGPQAFLAGPHLGVQFHPEVAEMSSVRPSGVRWLALAGLDLGHPLNEGHRHADRAGANGLRLFNPFAAHAASYSKLTPVGDHT
jgi:GMP synthase-like glutamine amidotransferase